MQDHRKDGIRFRRFHPGLYLSEAMESMGMSLGSLSKRSGISEQCLLSLVEGRTRVSPEIAACLGAFFGNDATLWVKLQDSYDAWLAAERSSKG